jgi:ABC-type multidrug transport system fused ATPase/permease subunit
MIQNTITNTLKDQTTIIIAHQFSNIVHADQIIVLKGGKVIESGNHSELVSVNGEYKKLYDSQLY